MSNLLLLSTFPIRWTWMNSRSSEKVCAGHRLQGFFASAADRSAQLICEVLDRWIIAIKAHHPFIVRKADRRDIAFKLPSESGLARAKVAVNQMSGRQKSRTFT